MKITKCIANRCENAENKTKLHERNRGGLASLEVGKFPEGPLSFTLHGPVTGIDLKKYYLTLGSVCVRHLLLPVPILSWGVLNIHLILFCQFGSSARKGEPKGTAPPRNVSYCQINFSRIWEKSTLQMLFTEQWCTIKCTSYCRVLPQTPPSTPPLN